MLNLLSSGKPGIVTGNFENISQVQTAVKNGGIILADNVLYKGYVMSDYNKHKQRTAVRHLREYIKEVTENPNLESEILESGDGLAITKVTK